MSRRTTILALALVALICLVAPAAGAPNPLAIAKKALRIANTTDKKLKRSYNQTHPTEVQIVDGGDQVVAAGAFGDWDVKCPRNSVASSAIVGQGALDATFEGSYGSGMLVTLSNLGGAAAYSGTVQVACVWGADVSTARAARVAPVAPRSEVVARAQQARRDAVTAAR